MEPGKRWPVVSGQNGQPQYTLRNSAVFGLRVKKDDRCRALVWPSQFRCNKQMYFTWSVQSVRVHIMLNTLYFFPQTMCILSLIVTYSTFSMQKFLKQICLEIPPFKRSQITLGCERKHSQKGLSSSTTHTTFTKNIVFCCNLTTNIIYIIKKNPTSHNECDSKRFRMSALEHSFKILIYVQLKLAVSSLKNPKQSLLHW